MLWAMVSFENLSRENFAANLLSAARRFSQSPCGSEFRRRASDRLSGPIAEISHFEKTRHQPRYRSPLRVLYRHHLLSTAAAASTPQRRRRAQLVKSSSTAAYGQFLL